MQSLDNILKPIGDRFNSPLYSTFLISWCVSNWKIFYVTFIMSAHELSASKLDYIEFYIKDHLHMFVYPLGFTVTFIYAFPIIEKEVLKLWYENKAERKQIVVEEMEKSPVSGEEYRKLLMRYVEREDELSGFFERERNWLNEKQELTLKYNATLEQQVGLQKRIDGMTEIINRLRSRYEAKKILDGRWRYTYKSAEDAFGHGEEYFFITPQNDYQIEAEDSPKYKIVYFSYDEMDERLHIVKEKVDEHSPEFFFADLRKVDAVTYEGREFGIGKSPNSSKPRYIVYSANYRKSGSEK